MKTVMKTALAAALLIGVGMQVQSAWAHDDDDKDIRDVVADYDYADFDEIEIIGVYELDIRKGDRFSVRTEASKKNAKNLEVSLSGDRLTLDNSDDKDGKWSGRKNNRGSVLAIITMPHLSELEVVGVATGEISAFDGGDVEIEVAGVVGDLELSGTCETLEIEMAGVGELDAKDLVCKHVEASLGGVGELSVHATESVEAEAGGIGSIDVHGKPSVQDISDGFMAKVRVR
jgi:hypothetical protein